MKTYPAAVASRATETPLLRLQQYFERNHITTQPCDVASKGCGEKRGYSLRRIHQIAITTQLGWLGIGPSRAAEAAFAFSDKATPGREVGELYPLGRTMLVGHRSGQNKIVNIAPDESLDKILEPDNAAFVIDCGRVVANVKSKMDNK